MNSELEYPSSIFLMRYSVTDVNDTFSTTCCQSTLNKIDLEYSFELGEPGVHSRTLLLSLQNNTSL